jgi:hypothetical protein
MITSARIALSLMQYKYGDLIRIKKGRGIENLLEDNLYIVRQEYSQYGLTYLMIEGISEAFYKDRFEKIEKCIRCAQPITDPDDYVCEQCG